MTIHARSFSDEDSQVKASPPNKKLKLSLKGQQTLKLQAAGPRSLDSANMHNIRPSLMDPMGHHISFSGGNMGLVAPYMRMDVNGDGDLYESKERDRSPRIEPSTNDKSNMTPPVSTLFNLGNTCFLNSVLYTLRFTPGFPHLLHHLASDLHDKKLLFLGERKIGFLSGSPGLRTKSLTTLTPVSEENGIQIDPSKRKILVLTDRLHELLQTLHNAEQKGDLGEPFQADAFLQALRDVNPIFQGNQQQDAHELLVCLLDYLRESCQVVDKVQLKTPATLAKSTNPASASAETDANGLKRGKQSSEKKKKGKKIFADKEKDTKKGKKSPVISLPSPSVETDSESSSLPVNGSSVSSRDFISESFEGVTVLRTTCLECEFVTERKESFMDICVPIVNENNSDEIIRTPSMLYANALMEVDFLRDSNKYWCEQCLRYNEARRSVHYEKLPRLLVLQLKRFSLSYGSTVHASKVNDYMPTPMQLDCFCEHCLLLPETPLHSYKLYAIIMHLGATMASGHYVAYTRICPSLVDYSTCPRAKKAAESNTAASEPRSTSERSGGTNSSGSSSSGILRFFKPKSSTSISSEASSVASNAASLSMCRAFNCCSAKPRKLFNEQPQMLDREKDVSGRDSPASSSSSGSTSTAGDDLWLECDDEVIRVLRTRELEDLLCPKPRVSALTPYLLFYVQVAPTQQQQQAAAK